PERGVDEPPGRVAELPARADLQRRAGDPAGDAGDRQRTAGDVVDVAHLEPVGGEERAGAAPGAQVGGHHLVGGLRRPHATTLAGGGDRRQDSTAARTSSSCCRARATTAGTAVSSTALACARREKDAIARSTASGPATVRASATWSDTAQVPNTPAV